MIELNLFSGISLILGIACILLSSFIFLHAKVKTHTLWAVFNLNVGIWGILLFLAGQSENIHDALFFWKLSHVGVMFIPVFFYHFVAKFCDESKTRLFIVYIQALIFSVLLMTTDWILGEVQYRFNSFYYFVGTYPYLFMLFIWTIVVFTSFRAIYEKKQEASGLRLLQLKYLFWGSLIGFIGGPTIILPAYTSLFYPAYHILIFFYTIIATYAIFKYHLMDIRVAFSRMGIFILVYSIVLGIPFGLVLWGRDWLTAVFEEGWFWPPMISLLILATAGPFIYIFMQRKAEDQILREERRTQELLLQASYGMNTIHNLDRLVHLIVEVVMKILRVNKAEIFLLNKKGSRYVLACPQNSDNKSLVIKVDNPMVELLKNRKFPLVYEEVKAVSASSNDNQYKSTAELLEQMSVGIVVPIVIDEALSGFLALGDRRSKEIFSRELLNALTVLGNQAALAIENCHYLEAETIRMQEEGVRERTTSLDHMASAMAHEIDNPMQGIRSSLMFIKEFVIQDPRYNLPEPLSGDLKDSVKRGLGLGERVSGMIRAILDYSRLGSGKLMPVSINEAVEGFLELAKPQLKLERVKLDVDVQNNLPLILGDKIQLEEILLNFIRNSMHAVKLEEDKRISLRIFRKDGKYIRIECQDNGYGIKKEIIKDIFLSSMTTKGSSEGTGLGLYRIRKIVDLFKGRVWAESEGKGKGATFIVELPVLQGNMEELLKENTNHKEDDDDD